MYKYYIYFYEVENSTSSLFKQQPTFTYILLYIVIMYVYAKFAGALPAAFPHVPPCSQLPRILCQCKWSRILSQISALRFKWPNNRANLAGPVSALKQAQTWRSRTSTNRSVSAVGMPLLHAIWNCTRTCRKMPLSLFLRFPINSLLNYRSLLYEPKELRSRYHHDLN